MKLKHLLFIIISIYLIYLDIQYYNYVYKLDSNNDEAIWWMINIIFGLSFLAFIIYYLIEETYFFEFIKKILNKKLL